MINTTIEKSFEQAMADHDIKIRGRIGGGLISLTVEGVKFSIEPCRPGYFNLVNTATNKVVRVLAENTKTSNIARICMEVIKEGEAR